MRMAIEHRPARGRAEQLILLLHGWGTDGRSLAPLADALHAEFPQSVVLVPDAPERATAGRPGFQWYTIAALDGANWPARVAGALAPLHDWVREQQRLHGVPPPATAIGGFSQGAILALELATRHDGIAGRVLAFGGRYVALPEVAPRHATVHLFHGGTDRVIPAQAARDALQRLGELQGDATIDIAEGIGHELHPALIDCALHRLRHHIPLRTWRAALGAAPPAGDGAVEDDGDGDDHGAGAAPRG